MTPPASPLSALAPAAQEVSARAVFTAVLLRDLKLASRRRVDALLPLAFFMVAISLFPLGVGPEPGMLRNIAPGIVWVCALLASMLSVGSLFAADHADGSLEQMLLAPTSALAVAAAKCGAHWLLTGLPLIVATPLVGLLFGMSADAVLALLAGLALGTPILSLLGGLGAALTLGLRSGGMLLILIVLPLAIPALIFGAGAVGMVEAGMSARGHFSLLAALLITTAVGAPMAIAAALRISTE
ncbi:heme exporter protein CcmB [Rubrivivax rivuli]|uniref:Heme exporter protein B n=1 Tax=Rubrivivax rivuli TaxID=1862385 RepID=A0A437RFT6_9BURK|nr:heme exporter protein CcmB [Rubrivivax rivuli]RVU45609.1 heme exporter protein CcmB [Rubrivivax rivuli]